jgi:hypothetical protein
LPFCAKLIIGLSGSAQSAYFLKCKSSRCACDPKLPAKSLFESAAKIGKKKKLNLVLPIDPVLFLKICRLYRIKACNLRPNSALVAQIPKMLLLFFKK